MTDPYRVPDEPAWPPPPGPIGRHALPLDQPPADGPAESTGTDLRVAAWFTLALLVVGAAVGVAWSAWSGPQQKAFIGDGQVIARGRLYPLGENETMVAADGRYAAIVAGVGLIAALVAWINRAANRGPLLVLALLLGGLGGATLTWFSGYLTGGGSYDGKPGTTIDRLPLTLHMPGLLLVEPAVALLLYGLMVAFAARDDLGRADPVRDRVSVGTGQHAQYGGRHGDAPGVPQQGGFPPQ
jgi:hypothetical protein